ncbi:hypothetical protein VTL71DRAFT_7653, partial [Oculimacula yallundae]
MAESPTISTLPSEVLMNIFCLFRTQYLLPLTITSRRIHDVIIRIIYNRLLAAANMPGYQVVLECYHPAAKFTTPYYICEYLGTDDLKIRNEVQVNYTLGQLRGLYSRFRPLQPEGARKVWAIHPISGWRATTLDVFMEEAEGLVPQNVDLESYEQFSQLQSAVNVVKIGSRQGVFQGCINVGEGLTRVWRNWLEEQAGINWSSSATQLDSQDSRKARLLWSSLDESSGLRLRVTEQKDMTTGTRSAEDDSVSYTLRYEELIVRTSKLLLKVEASLSQEGCHGWRLEFRGATIERFAASQPFCTLIIAYVPKISSGQSS